MFAGIGLKLVLQMVPVVMKFFLQLLITMKDISPEDRQAHLAKLNAAFDKATGPDRNSDELEKWLGGRL